MKPSPLAIAKKRFDISETDPVAARKAAKAKLVEAVKAHTETGLWIDRLNEDKGLAHVSNGKLLKLLDTLDAVKAEHGSRDALIKALGDLEGKTSDRWNSWSTPRLWDAYKSAKKRAN